MENKNVLKEIDFKNCVGAKLLCIKYDERDGYIKIQDRIRYLALFDYGWFDIICGKIKYITSKKSGVTDSTNHNFGWPVEKILTFRNVVILIKSVVNKNKNEYNYDIFLAKSNIKYF